MRPSGPVRPTCQRGLRRPVDFQPPIKLSFRKASMPVACTIVTGSLNVGKTTFIQALIRARPPTEKWAILVNEFGSCGVDGALLEAAGSGVVVKELAGGCMCCALNGPLASVIAQLLRQAKPDRLIIEPSGLGHPAGLLDVLAGEHLRTAITLQAVICLVRFIKVEVRCAPELSSSGSEVALDQISVSDIILGTKEDLASEQQIVAFEEWAAALWPQKAQVLRAVRGELPDLSQLLSAAHAQQHRPFFSPNPGQRRRTQRQQPQQQVQAHLGPDDKEQARTGLLNTGSFQGHVHGEHAVGEQEQEQDPAQQGPATGPTQRAPLRFLNVPTDSSEHVACGWLFHQEDVFHRLKLIQLLTAMYPHAVRLKGIFRCGKKSWVTPEFTSTMPQQQQHVGGAAGKPEECSSAAAAASPLAAECAEAVQCTLKPISYRRDSRLELIVPVARGSGADGSAKQTGGGGVVEVGDAVRAHNWQVLEAMLLGALAQ